MSVIVPLVTVFITNFDEHNPQLSLLGEASAKNITANETSLTRGPAMYTQG